MNEYLTNRPDELCFLNGIPQAFADYHYDTEGCRELEDDTVIVHTHLASHLVLRSSKDERITAFDEEALKWYTDFVVGYKNDGEEV